MSFLHLSPVLASGWFPPGFSESPQIDILRIDPVQCVRLPYLQLIDPQIGCDNF